MAYPLARVTKGSLEEPRCELMIGDPWILGLLPYIGVERRRCPHPAAGHWLPVPESLAALCECCKSGLLADGIDVTTPLSDMVGPSWFPGPFGDCPVHA